MKRQPDQTEALVYLYGCAAPIAGLDHAAAESARCRELWNALVSIERAAERAEWAAAAQDDPSIAAALAEVERLHALAHEATTQTAARALRVKREQARRAAYPALNTWRRKNHAALSEIEQRRRAAVESARKQSGLYWSNYLRVIADYEAARRSVRQFGRRLQEQRDRSDGCLAVQIQRTRSGLGAAPAELWSPGLHDIAIGERSSPRRGKARHVVEMRVGVGGERVRVPLILHRPLPEDMRVKWARLVWRERAGRVRYSLALTLTRPLRMVAPVGRGTARVTLGYEPSAGGLRVCAGDESLELSPEWMRGMDHVEHLHAQIDRSHKEAAARWRDDGHAPQRTADELADAVLARLRAAQTAPGYARAWRRLYATWRAQMDGLRARLIGQRREVYRQWARTIAMRYARIEVEQPLLAVMAQHARDTPEGSLRQRAALHTLVMEIRHQGRKHGAAVEIASAPVPEDLDPSKIRHISRAQRAKLTSARASAEPAVLDQ